MSKQKRENVSNFFGCLFGLAAVGIWFFYWIAVASPQEVASVYQEHPLVTGKVVSVGPIRGRSANNLFRIATLNFTDQFGRHRQVSLPMPTSEEAGFTEPLVLNQQGRYNYSSRDLRDIGRNPRDDANKLMKIMLIVFPIWILIGLAIGGLTGYMTYLALDLTPVVVLGHATGFARRCVKRIAQLVSDELKLRWEFRRRRKRLRPSPAYKITRRFQAELARMDPIPSVINARRQANELLTSVLERDNTRVEDITESIGRIRNDVDLDLKLRHEARQELAT